MAGVSSPGRAGPVARASGLANNDAPVTPKALDARRRTSRSPPTADKTAVVGRRSFLPAYRRRRRGLARWGRTVSLGALGSVASGCPHEHPDEAWTLALVCVPSGILRHSAALAVPGEVPELMATEAPQGKTAGCNLVRV